MKENIAPIRIEKKGDIQEKSTYGETIDEALDNIKEVIEMCLG